MLMEIATHQDEQIVQHITGDDIAANLEFLRAAGLLPPLTLPADLAENNDSSAMLGLTEAVKALAQDVLEKMDLFGKRLEALETQSTPEVLRSAKAFSLSNTLTPAPKVRSDVDSTPVHDRTAPWADRSVNSVPDYEETITWPDEEDETGGSSTKLFIVSESTNTFLQESFLKGVPNTSRRQMREKFMGSQMPSYSSPKIG